MILLIFLTYPFFQSKNQKYNAKQHKFTKNRRQHYYTTTPTLIFDAKTLGFYHSTLAASVCSVQYQVTSKRVHLRPRIVRLSARTKVTRDQSE